MPVPNDLTPQEEAEFAQNGVQSAGPGREPLAEENEAASQQQEAAQPGETEEQRQQRVTYHRQQDGKFATREEVASGQAKPNQQAQQQQAPEGQQPEGQPPEGQQPPQEEPRMVPLAALHQERQQRAQMARRLQMAEARMNALLTQPQQREAQAQMPDINEDPAGYILAMEQRLQRFEQAQQEQNQYREIDSNISADEETFASYTPDYHEASDHYVKSRAQELLRFYPAEQAQQIMLNEAREIAKQAWNRGMSAAEVVYGLAQARGYNPGMPNREPPQQQFQAPPQGHQAPQRQPAQQPAGPRPSDVIQSVQQGQQASRSLSGGTGASAQDLNASAILSMSDDDFAAWLGEGGAASRKFATIG